MNTAQASKTAAGQWKVFSWRGPRAKVFYFVRREVRGDAEYVTTPNGWPRKFKTLDEARAASAKATGSTQ